MSDGVRDGLVLVTAEGAHHLLSDACHQPAPGIGSLILPSLRSTHVRSSIGVSGQGDGPENESGSQSA